MTRNSGNPLPKDEFDSIYSRVPRLTVEVILRMPAGLVLVKRDIEPCKGQWHLPGGTVRFGESLPDAVKRVAAYEIGVDVEVDRLVGYIEYPKMHADGYAGWPVGIAFTTRLVGGTLAGSDQGAEVGCFRTLPPNMLAEQAAFCADSDVLMMLD